MMYPRPQLQRKSFLSLDGIWTLTFNPNEKKSEVYKIRVPFSPETRLSGVNRGLEFWENMCYQKTVSFTENINLSKEHLVLNFGAVDYHCIVFIDDEQVFEHTGGYLPFSIDIYNKTSFDLKVLVDDPSDFKEISRGKQSSVPGGIWYPKQSGIWQTVWIEKVPNTYIKSIKLIPDLKGFSIIVNANDNQKHNCNLKLQSEDYSFTTGKAFRININNPLLWTPENPNLYKFRIKLEKDSVSSYVGLRTFKVKDGFLLLNNKPYYHHGILDQGYYDGGLYTPKNENQALEDILMCKRMGFNMIRKHIKVEPLVWYYWCDKYGMLVWQDMVNGGGKYKFSTVTLPLFLGSFLKDSNYKAFARQDKECRKVFENEVYQTIDTLFNSTSIAMWVLFNEGWGQFDSKRIFQEVQKLDTTRTIDINSGWHDQKVGDFSSKHTYFKKYKFTKDKHNRAVILSEFGGYGLSLEKSNGKTFVYKKFSTREELTDAIINLYEKQIFPAKKKGLCASVYTQVSDVEQEQNGLVTYSRSTIKVNEKRISKMSEELLKI